MKLARVFALLIVMVSMLLTASPAFADEVPSRPNEPNPAAPAGIVPTRMTWFGNFVPIEEAPVHNEPRSRQIPPVLPEIGNEIVDGFIDDPDSPSYPYWIYLQGALMAFVFAALITRALGKAVQASTPNPLR